MSKQITFEDLQDRPPILTDEEAKLYQSLCTPDPVTVVRDPVSQQLTVSVQANSDTQHSRGLRCAVKPEGQRSLVQLLDEHGERVGVCHRANLPTILNHFGVEHEQTI